MLLYLSREDVVKVDLPMSDIVVPLDDMFADKGSGNVEMPPSLAFTRGLTHLFTYIPSIGAAGMKWVCHTLLA